VRDAAEIVDHREARLDLLIAQLHVRHQVAVFSVNFGPSDTRSACAFGNEDGARDNPAILRALADYIEAHRAAPIKDRLSPDFPTYYAKGEDHPAAVLNEVQIREIRALAMTRVKQLDIGQHFGVTQQMVSYIVRRKSWSHLPDPTPEEAAEARRRWDEQQAVAP